MGTVFGIMIVAAVVAWGVFWLMMLYEIGTRPDSVYENAGESKALWFLVVLVLQFFGTLAYFFMAREKLKRAEESGTHTLSPTEGPG